MAKESLRDCPFPENVPVLLVFWEGIEVNSPDAHKVTVQTWHLSMGQASRTSLFSWQVDLSLQCLDIRPELSLPSIPGACESEGLISS
jgi:hypothetical protein